MVIKVIQTEKYMITRLIRPTQLLSRYKETFLFSLVVCFVLFF